MALNESDVARQQRILIARSALSVGNHTLFSICLSVCLSVRIFDDFYEEDMEVVRMLVPTGTLTKKTCHEIRGPKKSMQKLGLAVDTGIGRDPFSDPVLSHFLHFF